MSIDHLIAGTGFQPDVDRIPFIDRNLATEVDRIDRGPRLSANFETSVAGLYFVGLPWQHTRGSALLGWVKDDADYIARQIAAFRPDAPVEASPPEPGRNAGPTRVGAA